MAYILTDGDHAVTYNRPNEQGNPCKRGKVVITDNLGKAFQFASKEEAEAELSRLTKLASGFSVAKIKGKSQRSGKKNVEVKKIKRRQFSKEVRREVYRKTEGHCYICGGFVDYEDFEVEHRIPLAAGGTNDISNLYCSCHMCNTMKGALSYSDMVEQAAKIVCYQKEQLGVR